jgi:Flp pilus assembly protein TadG
MSSWRRCRSSLSVLLRRLLPPILAPERSPGQAVVELSLLMVLLIPVIVGAVDLGRAYYDYDLLAHAVNEGARWASFDNNSDNIVARVRTAGDMLSLQAGDVTVTCYSGVTTTTKSCAAVVNGDAISVRGQFVFQPLTPWAASLLAGGQMTLSATAQRTFE